MEKLKKELVELNNFADAVNIHKKKHVKLKVAMYCNTCKRKHHFHFGEFKNGLIGAKNIQDIIDQYAWKYCVPRRRNTWEITIKKINLGGV